MDDPEEGFLSPEDCLVRKRVLDGECIVVGSNTPLSHWAIAHGRAIHIGWGARKRGSLKSDWANPFLMRDRNDPVERDQVCDQFERYLAAKPKLMARIRAGELPGKVLDCWCHPLRCHGDHLAELANKGRESR